MDRERRLLDAELRLGDLVLVELAEGHRLLAQLRGDVLRPVQRDECGIDGVLRPAERARLQRLGAVEEVVGIEGGVISGLFKQPAPALERRGRSRHDDG